jgi:hypothetical protein
MIEYKIPCGQANTHGARCTEDWLCSACAEVQFWRNAYQSKDRGVVQLIEEHAAWKRRAEAAEEALRTLPEAIRQCDGSFYWGGDVMLGWQAALRSAIATCERIARNCEVHRG